ncbi:MAG: valine--tRNA ligase, partial [Acidobacteriota bacterium]|nr:valine--tRNA ligase [Acidobacteriota bacterium]
GSLHMGHMLEHTEIDVTVRWHRMRGDNTLWLPGTDHAGIATQMVVERRLKAEGIDRREIGREEFVKRVWEWKTESGDTIKRQMIRMGASCDWSRERFTLDAGLSRAVREVFVSLFEKGLLYRGEYMVNWCPRCQTAISDLEVTHQETAGHLWHIRYPVIGSDRVLVVATTRPETMLGDTAVAVNARDARYTDLHGTTVRLPLMERPIPVIRDDIADPAFGTGVVKITPAHDLNDFEAGKRHNLERIQVINANAEMTAAAGPYQGIDRFEARKRVVEDLEKLGLIEKIQDYALSVAKCERCKTDVEPLISTQWFVRIKPLAEKAIQAVATKQVEIIPESWSKTYFEWMYNIRDWVISRQLWWGHRIPAWYCQTCAEIIVAREDPTKCPRCGGKDLKQDPDVLDTWFSSGLWPFSTLGWPDKTEDLATFYPTTLLITGFDILFFWVARMIMLGIEFMRDVPFKQVYIHGLVRDAGGHKMSKTRGNTIDPLVVNEQYGTDAVRMALLTAAAPGTDIVFTQDRMESARAFANKIWNAARFLFMNMERSGVEPSIPKKPAHGELEDRWIFSRLNQCAEQMNRAIGQYRYHEAAQAVWHFFWHDFCDWYIELKKLRFRENSGLNADWENILAAFEAALRLLHPVMPFLTEELWQRLAAGSPDHPKSIALAAFPQFDLALVDETAERDIQHLQEIITAVRQFRTQRKLNPKSPLAATLLMPASRAYLAEFRDAIQKLATVTLTTGQDAGLSPVEYRLDIEDSPRELSGKEREQIEKNIANSERQLSDEKFLSRAPEKVVESIRQKLGEYQAQLARIKKDD